MKPAHVVHVGMHIQTRRSAIGGSGRGRRGRFVRTRRGVHNGKHPQRQQIVRSQCEIVDVARGRIGYGGARQRSAQTRHLGVDRVADGLAHLLVVESEKMIRRHDHEDGKGMEKKRQTFTTWVHTLRTTSRETGVRRVGALSAISRSVAALTSSPHSGMRRPSDSSENDESRSIRGGAANGRKEEDDEEDDDGVDEPEPEPRGELPFEEPLTLPAPPTLLLPEPANSIHTEDGDEDAVGESP